MLCPVTGFDDGHTNARRTFLLKRGTFGLWRFHGPLFVVSVSLERFYWLTSNCPWIRAWEGRYLVSTFAVLGRYISNEFALERFDLQRDAEAQRCWLFRLTRVEPYRVFTHFFYFKVRVARTGQNIFFSTGQNQLSDSYPSATDGPWTCSSEVYIKKIEFRVENPAWVCWVISHSRSCWASWL